MYPENDIYEEGRGSQKKKVKAKRKVERALRCNLKARGGGRGGSYIGRGER